jgi:hypothetical protein
MRPLLPLTIGVGALPVSTGWLHVYTRDRYHYSRRSEREKESERDYYLVE